MKIIQLGNNRGEVLVSDEDFHLVNGSKWHLSCGCPNYYAATSINGRTVLMHRLIMNAPKGLQVDHINGNGLDNRRSNLRLCTQSQNNANRRAGTGLSSFKGVNWDGQKRRWIAYVYRNKKRVLVGKFKTELEAAKAYDAAALATYGEFAVPNFDSTGDAR